jgi:phage baseplate assembly protein W
MKGDIIGRGWWFPIKPVSGRLHLIDGEEKIRESIWIILSTSPGERVLNPEFGCGIHDLMFEPNSATLRGEVQEKVRTALQRWEPRIDVLGVRTETPEGTDARNYLLIRIDYRIRTTNAFYNLVYPFFIREGVG